MFASLGCPAFCIHIVALQREDGIWDCMYVTLENVQECVLMTLFLGRLLGDNGK